jgi:hypothetical protein
MVFGACEGVLSIHPSQVPRYSRYEMSLLQSPPHTYAAFLCFMGVLTATVSGYLASMMASSSSCCRNCKHPATGVGHSPRRSTRRRGG